MAAACERAMALAQNSTENPLRQIDPSCEDWHLYEVLKSEYVATATTSAEYEAACRRAAQEAGV